jgi:hypothetical protein
MPAEKQKSLVGWTLVVLGVALSALPLYAELFTKELSDSDEVVTDMSDGGPSITSSVSYRLMYVPPWAPLLGGVVGVVGGLMVGRARLSIHPLEVPNQSSQATGARRRVGGRSLTT